MAGFLNLAFSFPTVVYTTLLLVMLGYWLLVIVGAIGFDLGADGAMDAKAGALEAKMGVLEAKAGVLEAKTGALEAKTGLLEMLGFGVVPGTVVISLLVFWGWSLSMIGSAALGPALGGFLPVWASGLTLFAMAAVLSLVVSMASVKPLRPLFTMKVAPTRSQLLGKIATVTSGRVDANFGQASMEDGGAGLLLSVFCARDNGLGKGAQVLVLDYDEQRESYEVEPVEWLLPEELQKLDNPLAAEAVARAHLKQRIGN